MRHSILEKRPKGWAVSLLALTATVLMAGCGIGPSNSNAGPGIGGTGSFVGMKGHVHGGNQPVTGATVTIYLAGINTPSASAPVSTGYGAGARLLASTATDTNGDFNIPAGTYTCPSSPVQQAYIVASGGNPGLTGNVDNTDAVLMAALGTCPPGGNLIATNPFIDINEVTTVAAVWALQQFMAPPSSENAGVPNIGAPNTAYSNGLASPISVQSAVLGMNNAFTTARIMADVSIGATPNANYSYATPESAKINTLADIIAYCINSDPSSTSNCSDLFVDATPNGSTRAADTVQALYYMAQNPINNLANLYNYISAAPPFLPKYTAPGTLSGSVPSTTAFNDTTIAINYEPLLGGVPVIGGTNGLGIDAYGNVWLSNQGEASNPNSTPNPTPVVAASISQIGPDGSALVAPVTSFTASTTGGSISKFVSSALPATTRTVTKPYGMAIDLANQAWVASTDIAYTGGETTCSSSPNYPCGGDVAVLSASPSGGVAGGAIAGGYFVGYVPNDVIVDGSDNVFVANTGSASGSIDGRTVSRMSAVDGSGFVASSGAAPNNLTGGSAYLAIDTNPNVPGGILWASNFTACPQPLDGVTVDFGVIGLYGGTSDAALTGSEIGTSYDPYITLGAGTAVSGSTQGNCDSTNLNIGQIVTAKMADPTYLAVDRYNGVWLTNEVHSTSGFDGLTYFTAPSTATGAVPSTASLVNGIASSASNGVATDGTTLDIPEYLEVDGNNNVWVSNSSAGSVVEASVTPAANGNPPSITLLTPGQGSSVPGAAYGIGFVHPLQAARQLGIDASGNIWVANDSGSTVTYANSSGFKSSQGSSVTVIVGAAGPVITPRSLRLKYNKMGQKP